jgi:membrane protein required for colicin V production
MTIDIILTIFIAFLAYRGWRRGLIGEIVETVGVFVSIFAAWRFYPELEELLGLTSPWSRIVAAAAMFIVVMVVLTLIGKGLRELIKKAKLGTVFKALGLLFGALKAGLVIAALSAVLLRAGTFGENIVFESVVARNNLHVFAWISPLLPDEWEARVDAALLKDAQKNRSGGSNAKPAETISE